MEKTIVITSNENGEISKTYDKHIVLENQYTNELFGISLKLASDKVNAAKLDGACCSCSNYESLFQKNSWKSILQLIEESTIAHPFHYQAAVTIAFEKLVKNKLVVSDRANYIRTIVLELERIQSHLFKLGLIAKGISYPIFLQKVMTFRNEILTHIKNITELSPKEPFIKFGGIAQDISEEEIISLYQTVSRIERKIRKAKIRNQRNPLVKGLLKDVGFISRETARDLSLVGPLARTSGITTDVRKSDPYFAYGEIDFYTPVSDYCDLFGEFLILFDDIIVSIGIVRELLQSLPDSETLSSNSTFELSPNNTVVRVETPIGELFSFTHSKKGNHNSIPRLFKITCPLKVNMQGILSRITGDAIDNISTILLFVGEGWGIKL